MEKCRPHSSMFEPATYKISILGTLDMKWSDYFGGMKIEHTLVLQQPGASRRAEGDAGRRARRGIRAHHAMVHRQRLRGAWR